MRIEDGKNSVRLTLDSDEAQFLYKLFMNPLNIGYGGHPKDEEPDTKSMRQKYYQNLQLSKHILKE